MKNKRNTKSDLKNVQNFLALYLSKKYLHKFARTNYGDVSIYAIKRYIFYLFQTIDDTISYCSNNNKNVKLSHLKFSFHCRYQYSPEKDTIYNEKAIRYLEDLISKFCKNIYMINSIESLKQIYSEFYNSIKDYTIYNTIFKSRTSKSAKKIRIIKN